MRLRIILIGGVLTIAAAFGAPATMAAAPALSSGYSYTIRADRCTGPTYQSIFFKVTEKSAGWTPANGLTIDSWAEEFHNGAWHTAYEWPEKAYNFPANGSSHTLTVGRTFGHPPRSVRIYMILRFWKGGTVLAHKTLASGIC